MATIDVPEQFGCSRCWPADAADAWLARAALRERAVLVDDSHLRVRILKCPECAQQFVSVFLEFVDWVDGEDPQYWTLMPMTEQEVALVTRLDEPAVVAGLNGLAPRRRCLQHDSPKGEAARTGWGHGIHIAG